jgi:hypothetical protein
MAQSPSKVLVHLIFSTKHRAPLIAEAIGPRLHGYIVGILDLERYKVAYDERYMSLSAFGATGLRGLMVVDL